MTNITFATHLPDGETDPDFIVYATGEGSRNSGSSPCKLSQLTPEILVEAIKNAGASMPDEVKKMIAEVDEARRQRGG